MLQVVIVDVGHRIRVPLKSEILVGRQDVSTNTFPDVDLTPYSAIEKGVSRRHAQVFFCDGELTVQDAGSVNGTFLNGHRLTPYQAKPMNSGDVLQLGTLVLQIFLDLSDSTQA